MRRFLSILFLSIPFFTAPLIVSAQSQTNPLQGQIDQMTSIFQQALEQISASVGQNANTPESDTAIVMKTVTQLKTQIQNQFGNIQDLPPELLSNYENLTFQMIGILQSQQGAHLKGSYDQIQAVLLGSTNANKTGEIKEKAYDLRKAIIQNPDRKENIEKRRGKIRDFLSK